MSKFLPTEIPFILIVLFLGTCVLVSADSQLPASIAGSYGDPGQPESQLAQTKIVQEARTVSDKWALVVGISKYKDPTIKLRYAAKDAQDFYDYLVGQAHFASDHVKLLLDESATRENILNQLGDKWLPHVAMPNDLVVIYISSHGSPSSADAQGVNYLVAHNTDKNSLYATGIPIQDLTRLIKDRVHSDRVVVVMDACHSGAAETGNKGLYRQANFSADDIAQGTGQLAICSSEPFQSSWESNRYPNGVFTRQLIEGLRQKGDTTTLGEAFQVMQNKVAEEVLHDRGELQRPVLKSAWEGRDIVLAVVPAAPRPGFEESVANMLLKGDGVGAREPAKQEPPQVQASVILATTSKLDTTTTDVLDTIAPVWHIQEGGWGLHYNATWRYDKQKQEFDGLWDNGTQSTLKIVKFDGHHIILIRRNYGGQYIGNVYRYEGVVEGNHASGKYTLVKRINYLSLISGKWEASW